MWCRSALFRSQQLRRRSLCLLLGSPMVHCSFCPSLCEAVYPRGELWAPYGLKSALYLLMLRCDDSRTPDRGEFTAGWCGATSLRSPESQLSALSLLSHSELTSSTGKQALVAAWCMNSHSLGEGSLDYLAILKCLSLNPTIPFPGLYPSDILRCM